MFNFELVHVPEVKHKGPYGLSRRRVTESEEEAEGVEEAEEWVNEIISCEVWVASWLEDGGKTLVSAVGKRGVGNEDITLERKEEENELDGWKKL